MELVAFRKKRFREFSSSFLELLFDLELYDPSLRQNVSFRAAKTHFQPLLGFFLALAHALKLFDHPAAGSVLNQLYAV